MSYFLGQYPGSAQKKTKTGLTVISGKVRHTTYDLVITGPGVFNAAHALTVYLEQSSPALILQTGIAGIFKETGGRIGDIAIATMDRYVHTGIQTGTFKNEPLPFDLIAGDPLTRKGIYQFDKDRVNHTRKLLFPTLSDYQATLTTAPFITVSAITASFEQAAALYAGFSPVMEAMEGAACAHVAACYAIPMIEVRAASNFVGERDKSRWDMDLAARQLGIACGTL